MKICFCITAALLLLSRDAIADSIVSVESSPSTVREGGDVTLKCVTDADYFTCTWKHVGSGKKCTRLNGSSDVDSCKDEERYRWALDQVRGGL